MDEEHRVLGSFYKGGFERGEKATHIVDSVNREAYLKRLTDAGVNVQELMDAGRWSPSRPALLQSFHSLITARDNKTLPFPYDPDLATSNMNVQPPVAPTRSPKAKLAMSPSTLEDRIKALKIDKRRFKYG